MNKEIIFAVSNTSNEQIRYPLRARQTCPFLSNIIHCIQAVGYRWVSNFGVSQTSVFGWVGLKFNLTLATSKICSLAARGLSGQPGDGSQDFRCGVRVLDRALANKSSNGKVIDIYFKPEGIWCTHCQADSCRHIDFALRVPAIQEILVKKRREGWKLPSIEE